VQLPASLQLLHTERTFAAIAHAAAAAHAALHPAAPSLAALHPAAPSLAALHPAAPSLAALHPAAPSLSTAQLLRLRQALAPAGFAPPPPADERTGPFRAAVCILQALKRVPPPYSASGCGANLEYRRGGGGGGGGNGGGGGGNGGGSDADERARTHDGHGAHASPSEALVSEVRARARAVGWAAARASEWVHKLDAAGRAKLRALSTPASPELAAERDPATGQAKSAAVVRDAPPIDWAASICDVLRAQTDGCGVR
jgi:hypothetical protein